MHDFIDLIWTLVGEVLMSLLGWKQEDGSIVGKSPLEEKAARFWWKIGLIVFLGGLFVFTMFYWRP